MSTEYDIDFEIDVEQIGAALIANTFFMQKLTEALRQVILQQMRSNPAQFGLSRRQTSGYSRGN